MNDKEKIIQGLEIQLDDLQKYADADETLSLTQEQAKKIISVLKEQEIGHWIVLKNCSNAGVYCSECHTKVFDNYPFKKKFSYFCPHCGTRMERHNIQGDGEVK